MGLRGILALLSLSLIIGVPGTSRAESVASLSALKAAYTLHFLNLIRWEGPDAGLTFCVLGESEAGERMLRMLGDKSVRGRGIRTRRLALDVSRAERCDALYIPEVHAKQAPALLKRHETTTTVTISDIRRFANEGGVIGFVVVGERLRFDINVQAASRKRLKVSAKLLELARDVIR